MFHDFCCKTPYFAKFYVVGECLRMLKKPGKISSVSRVCHTTRYKTVGALFYLLYNKISIIIELFHNSHQQSLAVLQRVV